MLQSEGMLVGVIARALLSLAIAGGIGWGLVALVVRQVRRSPSTSTRTATQPGVVFIVCARRWQSTLLSWTGVVFIVAGCVLLGLAIAIGGSAAGGGIPGVIFILAGVAFLLVGRGVARARLEVTPDSVWVYRRSGAPRQVQLSEITRLSPLVRNNYGGVVVRSEKRRLFSATRVMLGYPQLIDYLHTQRPDLVIPEAALPL